MGKSLVDDTSTTEQFSVTLAAPDGYVNMRTKPGTDSTIITEIENGVTLEVLEQNTESTWYMINYNGEMVGLQLRR